MAAAESSRTPWWQAGKRKGPALVTAGVGVVGLAIGIGFGLDSLSKHDAAAQSCRSQCDQHGLDLWSEARSAGNVSTVAFIIGAAGLASGTALWLVSKPESKPAPTTHYGGHGTCVSQGWVDSNPQDASEYISIQVSGCDGTACSVSSCYRQGTP